MSDDRVLRVVFPGQRERAEALFAEAHAIDEAPAQYAAAAAMYERAVALDPRYAEAHVNLGVVYNRLGRFAEARASFERAFELDSRLSDAAYNLGVIATYDRTDEEAERWFRAAVAANPRDGRSHYHLAIMLDARRPLQARAHWIACTKDDVDLEPQWREVARRRLREP